MATKGTKVDTSPEYPWYQGNSRLTDTSVSGKWLAAHILQIGLIMFWVGFNTFSENQAFDPTLPMYEQGLVLIPHLAAEGFGIGPGGVVNNTFVYTQIGAVHMVASFVLFAGAYFHSKIGPTDLAEGGRGTTENFAFQWDEEKKLGYILGNHLLFIGFASLLFVAWIQIHGIYDPTVGEVRTAAPSSILNVFKYGWSTPGYNPFFVNNLEDIASGHLFIGLFDIAGGLWHINVAPFKWERNLGSREALYSPDGLLGASLGGVALMGFISTYFCVVNTFAYPIEFYGAALEVKFGIAPYFADTADLADGVFSSRAWLANITYYLAFYCLQGHLFHTLRAMGFKFENIPAVIARDTGVDLAA
ncbi:MAG: chlorophyll a/b binding light-harvesting protein [Acaryochloridaceae cyanobacterium SU_2_1]|nr:chlorophyll a/b binding light-harvesting protein [Acaryochloridaceae cyanobacterium SU_2_1]